MKGLTYTIKMKVWLHDGPAAWHFVTLPKKESDEIRELFGGMSRGWGSLPVRAKLGMTTWETSIFPDKESEAYILPLKEQIRKSEGVGVGSVVELVLEILI